MYALLLAAVLTNVPEGVELRVTFYDNSGLGRDARTRTLAEAERILSKVGVNVVWAEGDPTNLEALLIQYPERPHAGRETDAACRARADIALELLPHAPEGLKPTVLGVAQPFATAGLNVRLFMDRIEATARSMQQSATVVGGHVLAHEIGHVFLRSHEHSKAGLMAAVWGNHEYSRMRLGMLLLSRSEGQRIRSSLNRTGCLSTIQDGTQSGRAVCFR